MISFGIFVDIALQASLSFIIGFLSRFKLAWKIFFTAYIVLILAGLFFEPSQTGIALSEGLFTLWRWVVTLPFFALGHFLAERVKQ